MSPPPRTPAASELAGLAELLDGAFSGYAEALSYAEGPAELFCRWSWEPARSVVLGRPGALFGAAMASRRGARWRGEALEVVHVGPVAVRPDRQRKGLGSALMSALIERARGDGADLVTLTTQQPYGAWRLYRRLGFEVLEDYRPRWRSLTPRPEALPRGLSEASWRSLVPPRRPREHAISESPLPPLPAELLRARWFAADGAGVATVRWPVLTRLGGPRRRVYSVQVIDARGEGPALARALARAAKAAVGDGAVAMFHLPSAHLPPAGWRTHGAALTYRMCRALTAAGRRATAEATRYDERAPAP